MKRFISQLFVLVSLLFIAVSCQKAPFITLNTPRSFTFTRDGGSQSITFTCNRDWSVSSSESWIQVSPSSGKASDGEVTVKVTCTPNSTYDPRSATITVKVEELTEAISISQETGIGLLVSPKTFDLTNAEQTIEIEVQKNVEYSISIDNDGKNWIKYTGTKALLSEKATFHIENNRSLENREGKILFIERGGILSEMVIIRQKQNNILRVNQDSYNLTSAKQSLDIHVTSNIQYDIEIPNDATNWVSVVSDAQTKSLNDYIVTLSIESNNSSSERSTIIVFKGSDCECRVSIFQEAKPVPKQYDFEEGGLYYGIESVEKLLVKLVGGERVYSGNIIIPNTINHNGKTLLVNSIDNGTFQNSEVTSVIIGNNVKYIRQDAFNGCSIEQITIPASVKIIYEHSFDYCEKLSEIVFEDGYETLKFYYSSNNTPEYFVKCPIKKLYIGRTIDVWSSHSGFADLSNAEEIVIGPIVNQISGRLLQGASKITSLTIPSSVEFMHDGAFNKCFSLKRIIIEDGDNDLVYTAGRGSVDTGGGTGGSVNYSMFCDSPIEYVYIGRNLKVSKSYSAAGAMFDYCPIKELQIGKHVSMLPRLCYLRELEKLTLPPNMAILDYFTGCSKLRTIVSESETPPVFNGYAGFPDATYTEGILYVPEKSLETYKSANVWKLFFTIVALSQ